MSTKIAIAQLNFIVGDVANNSQKIIRAIERAKNQLHADLIVFPELAIVSYPPEDLLYRTHLYQQVNQALENIQATTENIDVLIGYPEKIDQKCFNTAGWIRDKKIIATYHKQILPNYSVFDEKRYFDPGNSPCIVELNQIKFGVLICEDAWEPELMQQAKAAGAECIICINASPYAIHKFEKRLQIMRDRVETVKLPIIYVNLIGGQDELIFDGDSFAINAKGEICAHAGYFQENILLIKIDDTLEIQKQAIPETPARLTAIYEALKLGVKDYARKNHFKNAIVAVSGGIDSALTLAIAADALGPDKVTALMMPSPYTAKNSMEDAIALAKNLTVDYHVIPIESIYHTFLDTLNPIFHGLPLDITEENIQARIRGSLLMALSNKFGHLVLATGNKSETAVGYCTLYGDMAGGFSVLKDVFKTVVYELAHYRNQISPVIPKRIITRPPSAELAPNQTDQDILPPYETLDEILKLFIEQEYGTHKIIAAGFDEDMVVKIVKMILNNEYKRRQAPPGIRISDKAFGKGRRYPITSGYQT